MNVVAKRITLVIPFAAMLLDVMSWFITKSIPSFAYVVVASGTLMGASMGMQILVSIYQMWFYSPARTSVWQPKPILIQEQRASNLDQAV